MSFLSRCVSAKRYSLQKNIEADNFKIPPLVLQPLVENEIRHGLLHKKQGRTVILHTWAENGDSIIEISDDCVGVDMANAPGQGATIIITIPGKHKTQKTELKKK